MGRTLSRRSILRWGVASAIGAIDLDAARSARAESRETERPAPATKGGALDSLLRQRRMVRKFRADPVDEATVARLIATATRAPSAGHTEPWAFVVVRDPERRRALARAALDQGFVAEAPVVIVACAELARSRARYGQRGDRYATIDTAFASLLLLLDVTEQRLGACFVGAFDDAEVTRLLGLPEDVQPLALIPVGWPAESPGARKRRPLVEVLHHERWGAMSSPQPPSDSNQSRMRTFSLRG